MAHFFGLLVLLALIAGLVYSFGGDIFNAVGVNPLRISGRLTFETLYQTNLGVRERENTPRPTSTISSPVAINPRDIPEGFAAKDLSPHFKKIRFGTMSISETRGRFALQASLPEGESVNVTGWVIRSNEGSHYVPQAVAVYDPSGLASESDIFLKNRDILYLYSGSSAIGRNFRLNKCIGYLQNASRFVPSLPSNCPRIDDSEIRHLSGECQDYLTSIGACKLPDANPPLSIYDYECREYLDDINYKGCFEEHKTDPDFFSREWRAWIGTIRFIDSDHDQVRLFDRQGLLVDEKIF